MLRFALLRFASAIPLLIAVVVLVFVVLQMIPGDPVQAIVGDFPVPPEFRAAIEQKYGLNDPLLLRLATWFGNLLRSDLGYSFQMQESVTRLLAERAPRTLLLAGAGYVIGVAVGLGVGVQTAVSRRPWVRRALTGLVLIGYAMPSFWLGQLLVIAFAMKLGWLPTQGMGPVFSRAEGFDWWVERTLYLILPVTTYAIYEGTRVARLIKASATETLHQGYILTARQMGLSRGQIIRRQVIRNSILPVVTVVGYSFGAAMGGAVLIETVFSWPGVGSLMVDAIRTRDNQVIVGVVLFVVICVTLMNVLVELLYVWIDPRIRLSRR